MAANTKIEGGGLTLTNDQRNSHANSSYTGDAKTGSQKGFGPTMPAKAANPNDTAASARTK